MNTDLAVHLSEHAFTALANEASAAGKTPAELAALVVERTFAGNRTQLPNAAAARTQFERCFGSVDLGRPIGLANDAIDTDLARDYGAANGSA